MNKIKTILAILLISNSIYAQNFAPAAGQSGTTAIPYDSSCFVAWASHVEVHRGYINIADTSIYYQGSNRASFGTPENAEGQVSNIPTDAVSLGDSGFAIINFENPITNGPGYDFAIFENAVTDDYLELGLVEVSSDGQHYVRFPAHSLTQTATQIGGFGSVDPINIYDLAGKYRVGFGTPFDLDELKDSSGIDLQKITHIKIIDCIGSIGEHCTYDAYGNKINELFPTPFNTGGFDLGGIGVIHEWNSANVNPENLVNDIKLYPNPSSGIINIYWGNEQISEIAVTNYLGEIIKSRTVSSAQNSLKLRLKKGGYFIQLKARNNNCIRKQIIIQ